MIKFILIAGVWVNVNYVTSLTTKKDGCLVTVNGKSMYINSSVWQVTDPRPCEEIVREIERITK